MRTARTLLLVASTLMTLFLCLSIITPSRAQDEFFKPFVAQGSVEGVIVGHRVVRTTERPQFFVKLKTESGGLLVPITREAYAVTSKSIGMTADFEFSDDGLLVDFNVSSPAP